MSDLMLHRGGQLVNLAELDLIKVPAKTDSYEPVSHYHLADKMKTMSQDLLTDYAIKNEQYALARDGNQMFAILNFSKNGNTEMGLSVAFRNSYDKSMSLGIALGASVFVCDNLAMSGDIAIMRKHTKNVWSGLEDMAIGNLYKAGKHFNKVIESAERLKALPMNDTQAYQLLGILYGHAVVSVRQMPVVVDNWLKPPHEDFRPRNQWSFFNAVTEALKTCPPISTMEKHRQAYAEVVDADFTIIGQRETE